MSIRILFVCHGSICAIEEVLQSDYVVTTPQDHIKSIFANKSSLH